LTIGRDVCGVGVGWRNAGEVVAGRVGLAFVGDGRVAGVRACARYARGCKSLSSASVCVCGICGSIDRWLIGVLSSCRRVHLVIGLVCFLFTNDLQMVLV
jgi:hypothetical protein